MYPHSAEELRNVITLEDLSPRFNDANWKEQCPKPGAIIYFSTNYRATIRDIDAIDEITIDYPLIPIFFVCKIQPDGKTFHARLCEPNLARSGAGVAIRRENFPQYNARVMIAAYDYGSDIDPDAAERIFGTLHRDYQLTAVERPDALP